MTNVYLGIVMEIVWSSVRMEGVVVLSSFIASLHQTAQGCRSRHLAAFFLSWRCSRSDGSPHHPLRPRLSGFLFEEYVWQGQTVVSRKTSRPDCSLCFHDDENFISGEWCCTLCSSHFRLWVISVQFTLVALRYVLHWATKLCFVLIVIDISNSFSGKDGGWSGGRGGEKIS